MNFFKNIFNSPKQKESEPQVPDLQNLPLEQIFVENFIQNGGKFLYCTTLDEVVHNLNDIFKENKWEEVICIDNDLQKLLKTIPIKEIQQLSNEAPLFINCEHLIAENGSVLFSSNQIKDFKIPNLSQNFIVYATTSQLVKSKSDSLTGIKTRYQGNIPSNISAINNFNTNSKDNDFMNYGNTNSKNLYLLLFEDL